MGFGDHEGRVYTGIHQSTSTFQNDPHKPSDALPRSHDKRSGRSVAETLSDRSHPRANDTRVLLDLFSGSKEGWRYQTHSEPQTVQCVHKAEALQDGVAPVSLGSTAHWSVAGVSRFKRRLPTCTDQTVTPEISQISLAGKGLSIPVPSIRVVNRAQALHEDIPTGHCSSPFTRGNNLCLPGRPANRRLVRNGDEAIGSNGDASHNASRIHSQSDQIRTQPYSGPYLYRRSNPNGCGKGFLASASNGNANSLCQNLSEGGSIQTGPSVSAPAWPDGGMFGGSTVRSLKHETNTMACERSMETTTGVKCSDHGDLELDEPPTLVASNLQPPRRGSIRTTFTQSHSHNRREYGRLGGVPSETWVFPGSSTRSMVPTGKSSPYQPLGAQSCPLDLRKVRGRPTEPHGTAGVRQHVYSSISEQTGGGPLSISGHRDTNIFPMVDTQENIHPGNTSTWRGQCSSRFSEQAQSGSQGVDSKCKSPPPVIRDLGNSSDRPVCFQEQSPSSNVLFPGFRSGSDPSRCSQHDMDGMGNVCFPPDSPSHQDSAQNQNGESGCHTDSSKMAQEALVHRTTPPVSRGSSPPPRELQSTVTEVAGGGDTLPRIAPDATLNSLETERRSLQDQGFSESVIGIMLASKRKSTRKVYDSRWSAYASWCSARDINPTMASIAEVLDFLTSISDEKSTNTLKGYVSAISNRHAPINGGTFGSNPAVTQWLKGLVQSKGISRSIVPPWDLDIVLAALKSYPFEPASNDKFATWKAVFLVAITSARRAGELHALRKDQPYARWSATGVTLFPDVTFLPKVNTPFHSSQPIHLPALHDEKDKDLRLLCVRRALKNYLNSSARYRKRGVEQLFICYGGKSRGQPISKSRISSWLVELITWVYVHQGLPTPQGVKGHQTRKQSTSIADLAGVDPQQICAAATWASHCTFAKHYRLNLAAKARSNFGRTVLQIAGSSSARRHSGYHKPTATQIRDKSSSAL